jgi:hypothetical protein
MNQTQQIKDHLESGKPLTSYEALRLFGCLRLAARIHDLRRLGMAVKMELVSRRNKTYAEYSL